jgi:hypothetical protein
MPQHQICDGHTAVTASIIPGQAVSKCKHPLTTILRFKSMAEILPWTPHASSSRPLYELPFHKLEWGLQELPHFVRWNNNTQIA